MSNTKSPIHFLSHRLPKPLRGCALFAICRVDDAHPIDILKPAEKEQWNSFESTARRREYVSTRWLIAKMNERMNVDPAEFMVHKDEFGKPCGLHDGTEYHISIAHTNNHVLCAISADWPVGVDMEPLDREIHQRLRSRILHPDEKELLKNEPTVRIWTIKEALVKLQGRGMRINLNQCVVSAVQDEAFVAKFSNDKTAKICSFQHDNNWLAVAWNN